MAGSSKECLSVLAGSGHSASGPSRENWELSHRGGALPVSRLWRGSEGVLTSQPTGLSTDRLQRNILWLSAVHHRSALASSPLPPCVLNKTANPS